jgi:hypothetical protein
MADKEDVVSWIRKHRTVWRGAALILLVAAVRGPCWFDRIYVPAQHPCSFRLEGDFCGIPASGTYLLLGAFSELLHRSRELLSGAIGLAEWVRSFGLCLPASVLVLPFFSTLLLILAGNRRRWQRFTIGAWGLAASMSLIFKVSHYPRFLWALWGTWLYIGLAVTAGVLEAMTLASGGPALRA